MTTTRIAALAAAMLYAWPSCAATVTVRDAAGFKAALAQAKAGDTIRLTGGDYGSVRIDGIDKGGPVTIVSASTAARARFTQLEVRTSAGLRFSNITLAPPPNNAPNKRVFAGAVSDSRAIGFSGLTIAGTPVTEGWQEARGLRVTRSNDVTVKTSTLTNLRTAIYLEDSNGVDLYDNVIARIRVDAIDIDGATDVTVARNRLSDFAKAPGDHADGLQVFENNSVRDLLIRDNLMLGSPTGAFQGIFIGGTVGSPTALDALTVDRNLIVGAEWHGISIYDANRATLTNNRVFGPVEGLITKSWIRLERVSAATVRNNAAGAFLYPGVGSLAQSGNSLLVPDWAAAMAAVAAWDATHMAGGLSSATGPDGLGSAFGNEAHFAAARVAAAPVPEPGQWALLVGGFLAAGAAARRRRLLPA